MKVAIAGRLAFPHLFETTTIASDPKSKPTFNGVFIIDPPGKCTVITEEQRTASTLKAVINEVAKLKWKDKANGVMSQLKEKDRVAYREGPKRNKSGDPYDGFEGKFHINASNPVRPIVLDRNKTPLTAQDGKPYAGCYVTATLDIWAQDNNWGQRINATLLGVQFVRDGDAFSGGVPGSADDFDDLGEGADASDDEELA